MADTYEQRVAEWEERLVRERAETLAAQPVHEQDQFRAATEDMDERVTSSGFATTKLPDPEDRLYIALAARLSVAHENRPVDECVHLAQVPAQPSFISLSARYHFCEQCVRRYAWIRGELASGETRCDWCDQPQGVDAEDWHHRLGNIAVASTACSTCSAVFESWFV